MNEVTLDDAIEWANKLLNYACASNRHILIKEYAPYLQVLLDNAYRMKGLEK